jgi:hypothetical protein
VGGFKPSRFLRIIFQFSPQMQNVDIDGAAIANPIIIAVKNFYQIFTSEYAFG